MLGAEFTLQSDHKPLILLINNKSLYDAPARCQRLLMRLARYSPRAEYVPGKYMVVADTLSRDVDIQSSDDKDLLREINNYEIQLVSSLPISEYKLGTILLEQDNCEKIKNVKRYTIGGWPETFPPNLNQYYISQNELSIINGLLVLNCRIVIPESLKKDVLKRIHDDGHLSLNKCRKRISNSVWWPKISKELADYIKPSSFCQIHRRRNHSEPLRPTKLPERPWQQLGLDIFELKGQKYVIAVDYFSR